MKKQKPQPTKKSDLPPWDNPDIYIDTIGEHILLPENKTEIWKQLLQGRRRRRYGK